MLRGRRVMLDCDLARIYGVSTARLNQQARRNSARFPADFLFQLSRGEAKSLMLLNATSKRGRGGRRKPPLAFTEHGAVMLAAVLNSQIAVAASIRIVRAFNSLRHMALAHKDLARALAELARKVSGHDEQFEAVYKAIQRLMEPPAGPRKQIGFVVRS
jgi:hypothetical protein